jgi:hypothetical protein
MALGLPHHFRLLVLVLLWSLLLLTRFECVCVRIYAGSAISRESRGSKFHRRAYPLIHLQWEHINSLDKPWLVGWRNFKKMTHASHHSKD